MEFSVNLLLTDPIMATRLAVAVYSLRRYYDGAVVVHITRECSDNRVQAIGEDCKLGITLRRLQDGDRASNLKSAYLTKIYLACAAPSDVAIYIDADTVVMDSLDELIQVAEVSPLVVTAFANQTTDGNFARDRWPSWRNDIVESDEPAKWLPLVEQISSSSAPLINTGVFAVHRDNPVLAEWRELADIGKHSSAPDEDSLQLLLAKHPHQLLSDQFNCIPKVREIANYQSNLADAKILHFATSTHLDFPFGQQYWMPVFEECCRLRIADIHLWNNVEEELKVRSPRRLRPPRKRVDRIDGPKEL